MKTQNLKFQYYPANIKSTKPLGFITLDEFLESQKNPDAGINQVFNQISEAEKTGNQELKAHLKQNYLLAYTPCVNIEGTRSYNDIVGFTGLIVLDFDHLKSIEYATDFKKFLFNEYDSMIAAWLSPSKHGVKALVNVPIVASIDDFKSYYFGISNEMEQFAGWDDSGQNAVLPLFQSYDPDLLRREDFSCWDVKGEKENAFDYQNECSTPIIENISTEEKEAVYNIIYKGMENIYETGHPQLRSLCLAIGGYVANGYVHEVDAKQWVCELIETHHYLKKDIQGYTRTAIWAIDQGMKRPLVLNQFAQ